MKTRSKSLILSNKKNETYVSIERIVFVYFKLSKGFDNSIKNLWKKFTAKKCAINNMENIPDKHNIKIHKYLISIRKCFFQAISVVWVRYFN